MNGACAHIGAAMVVLGLLLSGCSGNRGLNKTPAPEWVSQRPISSGYYIGIGSAPASPLDGEALSLAKKQAAADLASEIAVKVQSASLLESAENNGVVSERFTSSISSHAEERITGFEVADVWEGEDRVHVFYRLNKARHAQAREARRTTAMESARAEYAAGLQARNEGHIQQALNHFGSGIMALEDFWNEVNRMDIEGETVTLEPHLLRAMRNTVLAIGLRSAVDQVELQADNHFKFPLGIEATIDGKGAEGVPLAYRYHNGTYMKRATEFTDDLGTVVAVISGVSPDRENKELTVEIDTERLWKAANIDPVLLTLIGSLSTPSFRVSVEVVLPTLHIKSAASSTIAAPMQDGVLTALRRTLRSAGFDILDAISDPEFTVEVDLRKELRTPSGAYSEFHTAYVEGTIRTRDAQGQITSEIPLERSKGVQMDPAAALRLALSKTAEEVERTAGKKVADSLY